MTMQYTSARYNIGQFIKHKHYNMKGIIIDVDPEFQGEDEWLEEKTEVQKQIPWYHVLIHGEPGVAYISEDEIQVEEYQFEVENPMTNELFVEDHTGEVQYHTKHTVN